MEVYIIRHGETIWNAAGKLQGSMDIELNEKGRAAAGALGERLEGVSFDRIYASPLIRAYETACLIRGHRNIPIIRDDRLKEICFGVAEGIHHDEWRTEESPYHFFYTKPECYVPPKQGESFQQVCDRTKVFLEEVVEPAWKDTERIMIVAHGALNKGLMCHIEKHGIENYWGKGLQQNCEATIFTYDGSIWKEK